MGTEASVPQSVHVCVCLSSPARLAECCQRHLPSSFEERVIDTRLTHLSACLKTGKSLRRSQSAFNFKQLRAPAQFSILNEQTLEII